MRKMLACTLTLLLTFLLAGCGSDDKGRSNAGAPVNNIQDNVNSMQSMQKDLRDTAKANADKANAIMDERLKKK